MYNLLINIIQQEAATEVELECFDGNPLEYKNFADLFSEEVEKWIPEPKGSLPRLFKYARGEALNQALCGRTIIHGLWSCSTAS